MIQHIEEIPKINRALVIEDDPFWQPMIREALQGYNPKIELIFTSSIREVREILRTDRAVELVISDQPFDDSMTKPDLWHRLIREHSQIPYMVLSGIAQEEFMKRIVLSRMQTNSRIFERPDSLLELSEQLNRAISFYFLQPA